MLESILNNWQKHMIFYQLRFIYSNVIITLLCWIEQNHQHSNSLHILSAVLSRLLRFAARVGSSLLQSHDQFLAQSPWIWRLRLKLNFKKTQILIFTFFWNPKMVIFSISSFFFPSSLELNRPSSLGDLPIVIKIKLFFSFSPFF